jgi:fatty-acyl-CoA synthase
VVALMLRNEPVFVEAMLGVRALGAYYCPINWHFKSDEAAHILKDTQAKALVIHADLLPQIRGAVPDGVRLFIVQPLPETRTAFGIDAGPWPAPGSATAWEDWVAGEEPYSGPPRRARGNMPYTSGTTGRPKGCIHTHATVMSTVVIMSVWGASHQDSTILGTLPLFHVTGMQGAMNAPIYTGAGVVLMTRWDRDTAAQLIQRYRVEGWTNIATMAIDFLANPNLSKYDLSSLTRIGGGGAAMPEAVARRLKDLTGLDYIEGYGLSETIAPTHINPNERPKKQCLGIVVCNTDSRVIDPDTLRELGPGEIGEIVSSGPQVFKGYWKSPEASEACFIDLGGKRFFRTGDLGRYDEEGYFFIVDRLKRMINASGYKVWPAEVESILYGHPDVQEACVIGSNDPHRGETVKALVVLRASSRGKVAPEEVIGWCRSHMAAYKIPRVVEFTETLPKSATGKVQWRLLQEQELQKTA